MTLIIAAADAAAQPFSNNGLVKRADNFGEVLALAATFKSSSIYVRQMIRLVKRCGGLPRLDGNGTISRAGRCLLENILDRTTEKQWQEGTPFVWPCNETFADDEGISKRRIQDLFRELEAGGWLLIHYDQGNQRLRNQGIDLRPFGARLAELATRVTELEQARKDRRERRRSVANPFRQLGVDNSSEGEDLCIHTKIPSSISISKKSTQTCEYVETGETVLEAERAVNRADPARARNQPNGRVAASKEPLRGHARQKEGSGVPEWGFVDRLSDPEQWSLFARCSPSFRKRLEALCAPFPIAGANISDICAVLNDIREAIQFNRSQWETGLKRHGINAVYALLLAKDRDGVFSRAGLLSGILRRSPSDPNFNPLKSLVAMTRH